MFISLIILYKEILIYKKIWELLQVKTIKNLFEINKDIVLVFRNLLYWANFLFKSLSSKCKRFRIRLSVLSLLGISLIGCWEGLVQWFLPIWWLLQLIISSAEDMDHYFLILDNKNLSHIVQATEILGFILLLILS